MKESKYYVEREKRDFAELGVECFVQETSARRIAASAHIHDAIEILLISEGSFTVIADGERAVLRKGDMVLFRSNTIHRVIAREAEKNSYIVLKIRPSLLLEMSQAGRGAAYVLAFAVHRREMRSLWRREELQGSEVPALAERLLAEMSNPSLCSDISARLAAAEILLFILRQCGEAVPTSTETEGAAGSVWRAVQLVQARYAEDLTAAAVAAEVGMSYSYFSRSFYRMTGESFREYLNRIRLDHAERLLLTSERPVTEIALDCGYNNVSYFCMLFKASRGVSPTERRAGRE